MDNADANASPIVSPIRAKIRRFSGWGPQRSAEEYDIGVSSHDYDE